MSEVSSQVFGFVRDELVEIAKSADRRLGTDNHPIVLKVTSSRINWSEYLASRTFQAPIMLVEFSSRKPTSGSEWSAPNYTYNCQARFTLVLPRTEDSPLVEPELERCLFRCHRRYVTTQILTATGDADIDTGQNTPLNQDFIRRSEPLAAGSILITFVAGFRYVEDPDARE